MSGLASLELNLLEHQYRKTYQNLQKLQLVWFIFLSVAFPGTAVLHLHLKGVLSGHKSVTGTLLNNPTMRPPFSAFMNFHPKLSDSWSGLIIKLERSQCCNQTPHHTFCFNDVTVVTERCYSCVLKMWQLCSKDSNFDPRM